MRCRGQACRQTLQIGIIEICATGRGEAEMLRVPILNLRRCLSIISFSQYHECVGVHRDRPATARLRPLTRMHRTVAVGVGVGVGVGASGTDDVIPLPKPPKLVVATGV